MRRLWRPCCLTSVSAARRYPDVAVSNGSRSRLHFSGLSIPLPSARVSTAALPATTRLAHLEFLRGAAAIAVLLMHAAVLSLSRAGVRSSAEPILGASAGLAVQTFFMISGFVLTRDLLGKPDVRRFARCRAARLLPLYVLVGLATVGWNLRFAEVRPAAVVGYFTFSQNVMFGVQPLVPQAWTLACEVVYYASLPPLLLLLRGRSAKVRLSLLASLAVSAWLMRPALALFGLGGRALYQGLVVFDYAPLFLIGVALAYVPLRVARRWPFLPLAGLLALILTYAAHPALGRANIWLTAAVLAAIIVRPFPAGRWSVRLGSVTYGTYMWHWLLLLSLAEVTALISLPTWAFVSLALAVVLPVAELSRRYIELPARARFTGSPRGGPAAAPNPAQVEDSPKERTDEVAVEADEPSEGAVVPSRA